MQVTITIDDKKVEHVRALVRELRGNNPTDDELQEFFREDVNCVYNEMDNDVDLTDAVESFFPLLT